MLMPDWLPWMGGEFVPKWALLLIVTTTAPVWRRLLALAWSGVAWTFWLGVDVAMGRER